MKITKNTPTGDDFDFGVLAARIYSEHRGEIMRAKNGTYNGLPFSCKIAQALKNFRCTRRVEKELLKRARKALGKIN